MSDVQELIEAVQATGATIRAEGSDLKIKPAGILPPDLKERLREHKSEVLRQLELEASRQRLEAAGISVAVWPNGAMRIVSTEAETVMAVNDRGVLYTPADMLCYIQLEPHERRLLHQFKREFGGSIEWRQK